MRILCARLPPRASGCGCVNGATLRLQQRTVLRGASAMEPAQLHGPSGTGCRRRGASPMPSEYRPQMILRYRVRGQDREVVYEKQCDCAHSISDNWIIDTENKTAFRPYCLHCGAAWTTASPSADEEKRMNKETHELIDGLAMQIHHLETVVIPRTEINAGLRVLRILSSVLGQVSEHELEAIKAVAALDTVLEENNQLQCSKQGCTRKAASNRNRCYKHKYS